MEKIWNFLTLRIIHVQTVWIVSIDVRDKRSNDALNVQNVIVYMRMKLGHFSMIS